MNFSAVAYGYQGHLEAPRVDDDGTLYFTEVFDGGGVHRVHPDGRDELLLAGREHLLGIVLNEGGGLVVSNLGASVSYWNEATQTIRPLATSFGDEPIVGFVNDIEADRFGSVWAGTFDFELPTSASAATDNLAAGMRLTLEKAASRTPRPSVLLRIDPDGVVTKLWEEGVASNGLGFSPDGQLLYQCDTLLGVYAYDITRDRRVRDRRLFGRVPDGKHNGLAVDADGGVWVAATGSGTLVRFRSDGVLDRVIPVPATFVMSLTFGGADLQDLYLVTTDNLERPERAGTVLRGRSEIPGVPVGRSRFV